MGVITGLTRSTFCSHSTPDATRTHCAKDGASLQLASVILSSSCVCMCVCACVACVTLPLERLKRNEITETESTHQPIHGYIQVTILNIAL